ncbi:MAG: hypothetical protein K2L17_03245 [Muribaculaceae bacterium]|nr:hypothetical protein [Muribaculaceae bacterium]MDE6785605.1 hypothetical protein [Muribaculaceae bacterium]
MKKSLLLIAVAAFAGMANAQVVVGLASNEELEAAGLSGTKADLPAMTILENEAGSFGLAYADSWGTTTTYKTYRNVTVNGEAIQLGNGAVGNANPTFVSFEAGVMSAGAVFKMTANKDGYMTVFTKLNPNKQYLVFEGTTGAIIYSLGWSDGSQKIYYAMPDDGEGYINFDAPDASKYLIPATKQKTDEAGLKLWANKVTGEIVAAASNPTVKDDPDQQYAGVMEDIPGQTKPAMPWNAAGFEKAPGESTGFLSFPVYEGADYYFSALGSKAACGGFVYTEEAPSIVFEEVTDGEGNVTAPRVEFPEILVSGVKSVAVDNNADAPIYNLMGVRVNADAKGILIQNGKKFIRK